MHGITVAILVLTTQSPNFLIVTHVFLYLRLRYILKPFNADH